MARRSHGEAPSLRGPPQWKLSGAQGAAPPSIQYPDSGESGQEGQVSEEYSRDREKKKLGYSSNRMPSTLFDTLTWSGILSEFRTFFSGPPCEEDSPRRIGSVFLSDVGERRHD